MTHRDGSSRSSCRRRTLLLRQASLLTLHACMGGQGMQAYHTIPYHTYVDRHIPDIHMYVHSQMCNCSSGCTFLSVSCVSP